MVNWLCACHRQGKGPKEERVEDYLNAHQEFLDEYVLKNCDIDRIETWLRDKRETLDDSQVVEHPRRSRSAAFIHKEYELEEKFTLFPSTVNTPNRALLLYELAKWMFFTSEGDDFEVYEATSDEKFLHMIALRDNVPFRSTVPLRVKSGEYLAQYVAWKKNPIAISFPPDGDVLVDPRYPKGVYKRPLEIGHVLSYPMVTSDRHLVGVIELFRRKNRPSFTVESLQQRRSRLQTLELNDFLLEVTQSIFQSITDVDLVILRILKHAKDLVSADRASMFLVDFERDEMYAKIFDFGSTDSIVSGKSQPDQKNISQIRFPIDKGIAGYVASTGKTVNVEDAYEDKRFNREIDQKTGYHTQSILCMPILNGSTIIGVVQMVNKDTGRFTKVDECAFKLFAGYCGLALGHAQLYEKVVLSEQKLKVALDILTYHASCREDELAAYVPQPLSSELSRFDYDSWNEDNRAKPGLVEAMFKDLFPDYEVDRETMIRFILTVKKNYRAIPYHNWSHAFSVTNSIYGILKNMERQCLRPFEKLSLFVAGLCHDLDHMGKTNSYMVKSGTTLGHLYAMSTMENHHFNRAVAILQQDSSNILKNLNSAEFRRMLERLQHCILSTDLEVHFRHFGELKQKIDSGLLDFKQEEHRKWLMSLIMTASDLCANYKPFEQQSKIMLKVMEEFWQQGDEERRRGFPIVEMMDRNQKRSVPQQQIGFLSHVCLPCFDALQSILPELSPILDGCKKNIEKWKKVDGSYIDTLIESG